MAGTEKALAFGLGPVMAALLGMLTGIGGGMARDILLADVPVVLRAELYAVAALVGAGIVVGGHLLDLPVAVHVSEAREFFIELFLSTEQKFKSVSASVAKGFSSSSRLSPRERALLGLDVLDEPKAQSARPSVAVVLLAAYKVKGRTFFDGRVLSRSAQATLRSIAGFLWTAQGFIDTRRPLCA